MTPQELGTALDRWQLELPEQQRDQLQQYCQLLWEWNQKINLTRHDTYDKFVARDVRDSVELARLLEPGEEVLDVGSGGGVPGLLLAILRPDVQVSVSESTRKKANVLQDIVRRMQLPVPVYAERAERVLDDFRFSTLTARAVGPMAKILRWFQDHWVSIGRLLLVKGPKWVEERGEARHLGLLANLELRRLATYSVPEVTDESVILGIWPKPATENHR